MTRRQWLRCWTMGAIVVSPFVALAAPQAVEAGFTPLFNGKDLSGWVYGRRAGNVENRSGKGYQVDKNVYVTVEDEEIEALRVEATHTIEINKFVPLADIDPRYYDSPYYVVPNDKVGQDAFAVIREAMRDKKMVGVGMVVISKRERPIILEPFGKGLRGMTLRYPYEVRKEDEYFSDIPDVKVSKEMLQLAEHIVETKRESSTLRSLRTPTR